MADIDKYLILDEKRNAMDFLIQALVFLSQVEQNKYYLKWFIIAFHGAVYAFMLLALASVDSNQIYRVSPEVFKKKRRPKSKEYDPFDGILIDYLEAYKCLKNPDRTSKQPYIPLGNQDLAMKELNDKLRNQMIHFKPMIWGTESWYPARVCKPLTEVLNFCLNFNKFPLSADEKNTSRSYIETIDSLLSKHIN